MKITFSLLLVIMFVLNASCEEGYGGLDLEEELKLIKEANEELKQELATQAEQLASLICILG